MPEAAAATSPTSVSAPIIIQQALAKPEALLVEQPVLEPALASSALSQSAPSSFWHIQADHAYQVSWWHLPGLSRLPKGRLWSALLRKVPLRQGRFIATLTARRGFGAGGATSPPWLPFSP